MPKSSKEEIRLQELWAELDTRGRHSLLDFAEFLASRSASAEFPSIPGNQHAPRPIAAVPGESVVAALKRLRMSYPMLDHSALLAEATTVVERHVVGAQDVTAAIGELEDLFETRFRERVNNTDDG